MFLTVGDRNFRTHITKQKDANYGLFPRTGFTVKPNAIRGKKFTHADCDCHRRNGIRAAACASLAKSDQSVFIQMEDPCGRVPELLNANSIPGGAWRLII